MDKEDLIAGRRKTFSLCSIFNMYIQCCLLYLNKFKNLNKNLFSSRYERYIRYINHKSAADTFNN